MIGAGYSRESVLAMTPREIMFAVQPAQQREDRQRADALAIATLAAHDPKQASKAIEELG